MSSFVKSSLCSGQRPDGLLPLRHVPRPDLIARLLRSRHVPRFIVAPDGFGKTAVAAEYAETVFGFRRVFWISCRSPCFLRDLDAGVIAPAVADAGDARLVVLDALPPLDGERAACLATLVDDLVAAGCEVMVTCAPSADAYGGAERDRVLLDGRDLLLSEEESRLRLVDGDDDEADPARWPPAARVACLRWGAEGSRVLAAGVRREELPADVLLGLLVTLALGAGSLDDLAAFLPARRADEVARLLEEGYPFAGVDGAERQYRAAPVDVPSLVVMLGGMRRAVAAASVPGDVDALAGRLADALLARGACLRASELMDALASRAGCGSWLAARGWEMTCAGHGRAVSALYARLSHKAQPDRAALSVAAGWAAAAMGDGPAADTLGRRALGSAAPAAVRLGAAALVLRQGDEEGRARARDGLAPLLADPGAPRPPDPWSVLALVGRALPDVAAAQRAWEDCVAAFDGSRGCEGALLVAAGWVMEAGGAGAPAAWALAHLEGRAAGGTLGWAELEAGRQLAAVASRRPDDGVAPSSALVGALRAAEAFQRAERRAYRLEREARQRRTADWRRTHPDPFRDDRPAPGTAPAADQAMPPVLHVGLFGGMSVRVGDRPVDMIALGKRKGRTLLAILVLRRGSDLALDTLAEALWPGSDLRLARKNLSSTWSHLTRVLSVDGGCPYLLRDEWGCRLDGRLVECDVTGFEALCRKLLFGRASLDGWEDLYAQVRGAYADDLLPCEQDSDLVAALRLRYRTELSDALVAASERLAQEGEVRGALWFAREALRRDSGREDAYAAQMQAQIAAGQRAAALETYFACRAYLAEELGIDPSQRLLALYRSVIEEEVDV
ncbi:MAG: SARP family transcriptional regulator [Eggerthellaceae bacterium]|nr:SARP family transcriptional regulator [Eggerthellaceae bacterium]